MQLLFVAELPVTPLGGGVLPAALRGSSRPAPAPPLARVPAPPPPPAGWQESVPGGPSANAESFIRAEGSLAGASSPRVHPLPEARGRVHRLIGSACVCVCVCFHNVEPPRSAVCSQSNRQPVKLNLLTCQVKPSPEDRKCFDLISRRFGLTSLH